MNRIRKRLMIGLMTLGIGMLAGCQTNAARDEADATGQLGSAQAHGPSDVYVDLAIEYLRQRQYTPAMQNARKAVMLAPNNSAAHNALALVHQSLGQAAQAEQHFAEAVSLAPKDPFANNAYATFLCGQKRYDEADRYFTQAIANPLNPQRWVPLTNAAACASSRGDGDVAETYLRRALQANPRFAPALKRMAQISFKKQTYLSSRAYLQRYLEVAPHSAETLWLGIQTERILGDKDQSASYELLLREQFPDSHEARNLKGQ